MHTYHVTSTYSVPLYLARCACLPVLAPASVCVPADAWSTVDFLVRRPCPCGRASLRPDRFRPIVVPAAVCSLPVRACVRPCSLPYPFPAPIMAHFIRLYGSFSWSACRVSAPPQTFLRSFSSRRYLFSCRPRGWVERLYIAMRDDLGAWR